MPARVLGTRHGPSFTTRNPNTHNTEWRFPTVTNKAYNMFSLARATTRRAFFHERVQEKTGAGKLRLLHTIAHLFGVTAAHPPAHLSARPPSASPPVHLHAGSPGEARLCDN